MIPDANNSYLAYFALADDLIATAESASQIVEACAMDKLIQIFEWPVRPPDL